MESELNNRESVFKVIHIEGASQGYNIHLYYALHFAK